MDFFVYETGQTIKAKNRPIVIITSNNEKELPDAFLRRCFFHYIQFPNIETLGLNGEIGKVLGVLSVGAGAMTVSHVNDSYFWMVSQFSKMNTSIALKTLTLGTFIQGLVGIFIIFIISLILV